MRATRSLICALLFLPPAFAVQGVLPEPIPASRYDRLKEKAPFAVATPVAAPTAPKENPFENLYLAAIDRGVDGEGKDVVYIKSNADQTTFKLTKDKPHDGIELVGVEWSEQLEEVKVSVKKGNEYGTIKYDPIVRRSNPQMQQMQQVQRGPQGIPVNPQGVNLHLQNRNRSNPQTQQGPQGNARGPQGTPVNSLNLQNRNRGPVVPRPMVAPAVTQPAPAGQQPTERRKIRVIPSPR